MPECMSAVRPAGKRVGTATAVSPSDRGEGVRESGGVRRSWGKVMAAWFPCYARTYVVIYVVTVIVGHYARPV